MKSKKAIPDAVRAANRADQQPSTSPRAEQGKSNARSGPSRQSILAKGGDLPFAPLGRLTSKSAVPKERMSKAEANRKNSLKSTGPKSATGKQNSRMNAQKNGFFSKDVVVTAAGERMEDFEQLEASVWADVQPNGAVEEMLAHDYCVNWWRRQRVRRCESAELGNRLGNLRTHDSYLRGDEIDPLNIKFHLSLERYKATTENTPSGDLNDIVTELENCRSQLASTPLGLEFLIKKVHAVKKEAESTGQMSRAAEAALRACAGVMNEFAMHCGVMNRFNKTQLAKAAERTQAGQRGRTGQTKAIDPEKAKGDQSGGKREAAGGNEAACRLVLVSMIETVAHELEFRKQLLEAIEQWQDKTRLAAAVLPADNTCDRFARAETTYDRRLYRALAALTAIKQARNASKILP